jgi:hypothetical protein
VCAKVIPVAATVFNLTLDWVIKKLSLRGDISLKLKQIVACADDVALLARYPKALKKQYSTDYKMKQSQ